MLFSTEEVTSEQIPELNGIRKTWVPGVRAYQAENSQCKGLQRVSRPVWYQKTAKRPVWLEWREQKGEW